VLNCVPTVETLQANKSLFAVYSDVKTSVTRSVYLPLFLIFTNSGKLKNGILGTHFHQKWKVGCHHATLYTTLL